MRLGLQTLMSTISSNTEVFNDGVMRAEELSKDWIFLTWENNEAGYLPVSLVRNLRKMESTIKQQKKIGWVCNSEKSHKDFHNILRRVGAEVYDEDDEFLFFKKEIKSHV